MLKPIFEIRKIKSVTFNIEVKCGFVEKEEKFSLSNVHICLRKGFEKYKNKKYHFCNGDWLVALKKTLERKK